MDRKGLRSCAAIPATALEAGARLLALVLISDGHVCRSEIETLQRLQVEEALGLTPATSPR
jgi:hypothetical protein